MRFNKTTVMAYGESMAYEGYSIRLLKTSAKIRLLRRMWVDEIIGVVQSGLFGGVIVAIAAVNGRNDVASGELLRRGGFRVRGKTGKNRRFRV
jgi:hypothetical protein